MTTLVTGATGFLGSAVARSLIARGDKVRVLVRASSPRSNLDGMSVEVVEGDLADPVSLRRCLVGCSALYHVAADYRLWAPQPQSLYRINVDATRDLLSAAVEVGVSRIVYTSSVATLGMNPDGASADEETPVALDQMIGHYKRSKFLAEQEVLRLTREKKAPVVIVNPSTPVGPRDIKPTPTGKMVVNSAAGRMPAYVDTGLNIVHVDDVALGHLLAFERGLVGERYILGGENLSLYEVFSMIAALTGRCAPRVRLPHWVLLPVALASEGWSRWVSGREPVVTLDCVRMARKKMFFTSAKAERVLGYRARPAVEAFRDAVTWLQETGRL
ncbi:putative dihydroflavonol 4-reductase [Azospirillaceae bacterium]